MLKTTIGNNMKYIFLLFTFLVIFGPLHSHANDYVVKNIRVDVTADSATEARNKALEKARMNAFNVLKGRVVPQSEQASLPEATSSVVSTMVDSFEINREKLSKNRYLASVNVTFNERAVQTYLGRHTNMALSDEYYQDAPNINDAYVPGVSERYDPQFGQSGLYQQYQDQKQASATASRYKMQVNLNGLRQWVSMQKSLQSIGHVQIQSLRADRAIIDLSYDGDASALQNALSMKGLQLFSNPAGDAPYVLMVRG